MSTDLPNLDEVQARADAATEGQWSGDDEHGEIPGAAPAWVVSRRAEDGRWVHDLADVWGPDAPANAAFIAHARTDVPALLKATRAALRVADQLERLAARHPDSETGQVEAAAAHEIRSAVTAHIDITPRKPADD